MAEVLYGHAAEAAGLRGHERVFDLYCGIGTIGLSLAARAREVVGVELVETAVSDAIENARLNEITNASFFAGDIRLAMRELVERAGKPDVVVIDPPRAGLSQKVVRRIIEAAPQRIVYVSCNPTTLAPNAAQLVEAGWALKTRAARRHVPPDPAHRVRRTPGEAMSLTRVSRFGFVNAFLVEEEDGLTLIDTTIGGRGSAKAILAAAGELGRPIVRIALTHAHGDHIGALDALAEQLPGVEVAISDARRAPARQEQDDRPRRAARGEAARLLPGRQDAADAHARRRATASARSRSSPRPGHTPGHVAFLDTRDRTLIAGDAFSTLGGVATTAKINPRFPFPRLATWHRPTALETARALRALDPPAARGRPRPDRRRARRRDGRGDREGRRRGRDG